MRSFIILLLTVFSTSLFAQDLSLAKVDFNEPKKTKKKKIKLIGPAQLDHKKISFQEEDGKIYWQANLPVYITISSSPKEEGMQLKEVKVKKMEEFAKPMYFDGHGVHYLRHHDYEHNLPEQEVAYAVHVDGYAPITNLKFLNAPKYVSSGKVFFGKDLSVELNSTDEMSGLKQILQSTNGADYSPYINTVTFTDEKSYEYFYYAADKVGNVEKPHHVSFTVDTSNPTTNLEVNGDHLETILSPRSTISLTSNDELSGVKSTKFSFDGTNETTYSSKLWLSYLGDGDHEISYYATDNVKNQEGAKSYKFYLDKVAPEVTSEIVGDRHENSKYVFISERSKVKLVATDNKAGVETIWFKIGNEMKEYSEPFDVDLNQGSLSVKFKAMDKVKNKSNLTTNGELGRLFLDKKAPRLDQRYIGQKVFTRDTTFITSETKIRLIASDYESGVQTIAYNQDQSNENEYSAPFTITKDGYHEIAYKALDNVNNESEDNFFMVVDNEGPEVYHHTSLQAIGSMKLDDRKAKLPVYTHGTKVFLAATDKLVGTKDIYYSIDGGGEKLYSGPIVMKQKGIRTIKVRSDDKLGNETSDVLIELVIN